MNNQYIIINTSEIDEKILATESGPERNALCDFNILVRVLGKEIKEPVFILIDMTDKIATDVLVDDENYFVVTTSGLKKCWKGHAVKIGHQQGIVKSILIEDGEEEGEFKKLIKQGKYKEALSIANANYNNLKK